jgi:hypothetical protein
MAFLDAVLETTPINYLHQYLVAKGKVSKKDCDLKVRPWIATMDRRLLCPVCARRMLTVVACLPLSARRSSCVISGSLRINARSKMTPPVSNTYSWARCDRLSMRSVPATTAMNRHPLYFRLSPCDQAAQYTTH